MLSSVPLPQFYLVMESEIEERKIIPLYIDIADAFLI